jgi:DNA ligase (NAD+)
VKIGDTVMVRKAGDIIPQVFDVLVNLRTGKEKKIVEPKNCPICKSELLRDEASEGIKLICKNENCEAKVINKIIYFASRKVANIDGLGESTVQALFDAGFIKKVSDIYKLKYEQVAQLEGFKEKSITNLLSAIENSKTLPLQTFIMGLSINNVGEETNVDIAKHFKSLDAFLSLQNGEIEKIFGIGEKIKDGILDFFAKKENIAEIKELLRYIKVLDYKDNSVSQKLSDKRFVVTGTFPEYSRDEIEKLIKENGGAVQNAVNAKTSYLIVGEDAGSKLEKANKLGILTIGLKDFLNMI